jgi:hypothetical protein
MKHHVRSAMVCMMALLPVSFFCSPYIDKAKQKTVLAAEKEPLARIIRE